MSIKHRTVRPQRAYATIPNAALRDRSISIAARGFLAMLMSHDDSYEFHPANLMRDAGIKKDKYYKILRELQDASYLRIEERRDDQGRFVESVWYINESPENKGSEPCPEKPDTAEPDTGKPDAIRRQTPKNLKREEAEKAAAGSTSSSLKDFEPDEELRRWAFSQGFTEYDIEEETTKFRIWWGDQVNMPSSLSLSWRNWMEGELAERTNPRKRLSTPKKQRSTVLAEIQRREARQQAELAVAGGVT
ncbi:hypothetical protein [Roseovarius sp.]|uniref:hypothetical protein n=1 Tax=Roseovarius sp. TaxID=1486281 RepID=UPI003BA93E00